MNHTDHTKEFDKLKNKLLTDDVIYLFGYGSLLWKVDFEYTKKIYGFVKNYKRHFWLLSDDHRGTPDNMGRVVTLVKTGNDQDKVYGIAYEIHTNNIEKTFENLHVREKCGYSLKEITFFPQNDLANEPIYCVCYYANEDNSYFSPSNDLSLISAQIYKSVGPSGTNKAYLYNLCNVLRSFLVSENKECEKTELDEILKQENHLFLLEAMVKQLENNHIVMQ